MDLKRLCGVAGFQVCYNCVLSLMPVLHGTDAVAVTSSEVQTDKPTSQSSDDNQGDMMKGLAAGFGLFFGLIILVCLVWCLCCANVCNKDSDVAKEKRQKSKVSPSPPHSASVRTRPASTSSP